MQGGSGLSRTNGSGYPLSVPAVAHPPPRFQVLGGGKGEVKPPKCPTRHPRVAGLLLFNYYYYYLLQVLLLLLLYHTIYIYVYVRSLWPQVHLESGRELEVQTVLKAGASESRATAIYEGSIQGSQFWLSKGDIDRAPLKGI